MQQEAFRAKIDENTATVVEFIIIFIFEAHTKKEKVNDERLAEVLGEIEKSGMVVNVAVDVKSIRRYDFQTWVEGLAEGNTF